MTTHEILNIIDFPDSGRIDKKIFKKAMYENAGLTKRQIEVVKNEISELRALYELAPLSINIPVFFNDDIDYQRVLVVLVKLDSNQKVKHCAHLIQKALYDPVILLTEHEDRLAVSVASKRINKADVSKSVIDEEYITNWISGRAGDAFIESLKVEKLSLIFPRKSGHNEELVLI